MKEGSFTGKVWRSWFPRETDANEVRALVTRLNPDGNPEDLVGILSGETRGTSFVELRLNQWLGRVATDADTKLIEAIARKLKASSTAVQNAIDLQEGLDKLRRTKERLTEKAAVDKRAAELADLEHQVKKLELEIRKAEINRKAESKTIRSLEEERALTELAELQAKRRALDNENRPAPEPAPAPPPPPHTPWWGKVSASANQDMREKLRDQMKVDDIAQYLRDKYRPDIELAKKRGDHEGAAALERELNKLLDDLATGEYEP